ncbi:MAG: hypothetical protein IT200_04015 [Thermoleophilia bacterium]|nr:hypothetical protein [Thermoleophilia bacterium]
MTALTARRRSPAARRAAVIAVTALLAAAAHASAVTVVPAPGGIAVTDPRGAADDLVIGFPAPETVRVHSAAGPLALDPRIEAGFHGVVCNRVDPATAVCRPDDAMAGMRLQVRTGAGDDRVRFTRPSSAPGGVLAPRVTAGAGDDTVIADGLIEGGDGDDTLRVVAGATPAALLGGAGDDILVGGAGGDVLMGGAGRDRLVDRSAGNRFVGGPGRDVAVIGKVVRASSASLAAGGAEEPPGPVADVIIGVEAVRS